MPPFWVGRVAAYFREDPTLGAVYGPVRWYDGRPVDQWVQQYPIAWAQWLSHRAQLDLWWGSNFAVRRDVFCAAGGFPLQWGAGSGEDTDLARRVSRIATVRFDPDLVVCASSRRMREGWARLAKREATSIVNRLVLRRRHVPPISNIH